jgi:hypothetical protein
MNCLDLLPNCHNPLCGGCSTMPGRAAKCGQEKRQRKSALWAQASKFRCSLVNIGLPDHWFLTFYPSNDIRINFADAISGQTGPPLPPA